jgi:hypothetical protein
VVAPRFIDQELAGSGYGAAVGGLQPPRYQSQRQESTVATLAISIVLPPTGELETTGDGSSPTQAQMDEEMKARSAFVDTVSPYLKSLPERSPHRAGNVSRVELLGRDVWSELNHYLLLATVDIGDPGIEQELSALLPHGTQISGLGDFNSLQEWPEPAGTAADPN